MPHSCILPHVKGRHDRHRPLPPVRNPSRRRPRADDSPGRHRRRRRRRAVSRTPPLRGAGLRRRAAQDRELRRLRGVRAARGQRRDGRLCAFHRDLGSRAEARGRNRPARRRRGRRHAGRRARGDQPQALHRCRPDGGCELPGEGRDAARNRRLCARQGPPCGAGLGHGRREPTGGAHPAPRRHAGLRHKADGAAQRQRDRRTGRTPRVGRVRRRRARGARCADPARKLEGQRRRGAAYRAREPQRRGRAGGTDGCGARRRLARDPAARGGGARA